MITNHVFRLCNAGGARYSRHGMCAWNDTCTAPEAEHITAEEFRRRRAFPLTSRHRAGAA